MSRKVHLDTHGRDLDWTLHVGDENTWSYDQIQIGLLNDIRRELRSLNQKLSVLQCPNFIAIPRKLDRIGRNTAKKRKPRAVGKPKLRVVRS